MSYDTLTDSQEDSVLSVLQRELEFIQQSLKGMSPVVQVLGLSPSLVENILPVLFPSVTFVSGVDSLDCVGVHATLSVGSEDNQCYTTWNLRLDESRSMASEPFNDIVPQAIQWLVQNQAELF
jgi:hypothetical protein